MTPVAVRAPRLAAALLCVALAIVSADARSEATPFRALYALSRDHLPIGHTEVRFELQPNGGYRYRAETTPTPLVGFFRDDHILEESRGTMRDGRPRPDHYSYRRRSAGVDRNLDLRFDWTAGRVWVETPRGRWSQEIPPDTLDKLVQQWVFSQDLAEGAATAEYPVADGGLLKRYRYRVEGDERLGTPLGSFATLKVTRSKDGGEPDYSLWLATQAHCLPVRIDRLHDEHLYRMEISELEPWRENREARP